MSAIGYRGYVKRSIVFNRSFDTRNRRVFEAITDHVSTVCLPAEKTECQSTEWGHFNFSCSIFAQ